MAEGTMTIKTIVKGLILVVSLVAPARALAHCDGMDGPVVKAAQQALEKRDPTLVLIWVKSADEPQIRAAFEQTLAVRVLSPQAKELADRFFFETVVRVHRLGEGEPYTGLKPAGRDLGPAIPAADKAVDEKSVEPVLSLLTETIRQRVLEHFNDVLAARPARTDDVAAGRKYVQAYIEFVHYIDRLYSVSMGDDAHRPTNSMPCGKQDDRLCPGKR